MYRSCAILASTLVILMALSGCAKKNPQLAEAVSPNPVVPSEPSKSEDSKPAQIPEQKDQLVDAGLFSAEDLVLETVYFDYDSYVLSDETRANLKSQAALLRVDMAKEISIEGHCDDRGSDSYNLSLGQHRANAVKNYLASLGIEEARMKVISFGEERPAVIGSDKASWAKNRRVEFN